LPGGFVDVDVVTLEPVVVVDELRKFVDPFGNILGGRAAVRNVVFDPEIRLDSAGVVAGGEHQPAESLAAADDR
jgi:hypothetical protein